MEQELLKELDDTEIEFSGAISSFNDDEFNIVPFEGSWTAGQVAKHILLSASSLRVLYGPVKKTSRPPDGRIEDLKSVFLDFNLKMKSPDFIIPEKKDYQRSQLQDDFKKTASQLKEAVKTLDLSEICVDTPSVLGELTRLELISFIILHTKRHTRQLKNIKSHMMAKVS